MRRSPRLKNKRRPKETIKNPWSEKAATLWWRTGQWTVPVRCAPDRLSREPATRGSRGCSIGLSSVYRTVWPTIGSNGRLLQTSTVGSRGQGIRHIRCAPDCPVRSMTEQSAFWPTTIIVEDVINIPPTDHFKVWEPSNIPRHIVDISKCSNTQVLNRITRCLA
jgi:hypothetical protein